MGRNEMIGLPSMITTDLPEDWNNPVYFNPEHHEDCDELGYILRQHCQFAYDQIDKKYKYKHIGDQKRINREVISEICKQYDEIIALFFNDCRDIYNEVSKVDVSLQHPGKFIKLALEKMIKICETKWRCVNCQTNHVFHTNEWQTCPDCNSPLIYQVKE